MGTSEEEKDTTNTTETTSDEEVESLLTELETTKTTTTLTPENAAALEKLLASTKELTSTLTTVTKNIDTKYDVSTNAIKLDTKLGVSSTAKSTYEALCSLLSSVQSYSTTQTVKKIVTETVLPKVGSTAVALNEKTGLTERVKKLDQDHALTQTTLEKLVVGVDWVNERVKKTSVATTANPTPTTEVQ